MSILYQCQSFKGALKFSCKIHVLEQGVALPKSVCRQEITNLSCFTVEMTSATNKWRHIYFTDAKPASACRKQMGSQISWLQFWRSAGNLSYGELV